MPVQDIDRTGRIVGGRNTTIEAHPYQIALFYTNRHLCGGAILNASKIILITKFHFQCFLSACFFKT